MTTEDAFALLGISGADFSGASTAADAREILATWKVEVLKPAYRKVAKAWHPDLGPSDEEEGRNAMLVEVNQANDLLQSLQVTATMRLFGVPIRIM